MGRFINLTKGTLRIRAENGSFIDIPPSGTVASIKAVEHDEYFGLKEIYNKDHLYIVDRTVSDIIVDRHSFFDFYIARSLIWPFFIPGDPIYKDDKFIGHNGLKHPHCAHGVIKDSPYGPMIEIRRIKMTNELEN
jgi:hypothetical protein